MPVGAARSRWPFAAGLGRPGPASHAHWSSRGHLPSHARWRVRCLGRYGPLASGASLRNEATRVDDTLKGPALRTVTELRAGRVAPCDDDVGDLLGLDEPREEALAARAIGIAEKGVAGDSDDPSGRERDGKIGATHRYGWPRDPAADPCREDLERSTRLRSRRPVSLRRRVPARVSGLPPDRDLAATLVDHVDRGSRAPVDEPVDRGVLFGGRARRATGTAAKTTP